MPSESSGFDLFVAGALKLVDLPVEDVELDFDFGDFPGSVVEQVPVLNRGERSFGHPHGTPHVGCTFGLALFALLLELDYASLVSSN
jgi:hypothetical protein